MRFIDCRLSGSKQIFGGSSIAFSGHMTVIGENPYDRQMMPLADFEIVRIMCRRNFDNTGAFFHISMIIAYDRNLLIDQRQNHMTSMQMHIPRISGIHRYSSIAKHGFRPCRCQFKHFTGFLYRIQNMPEMTVFFNIFNFRI